MDFWQWLKDLFRRMGASQTNNTYGMTGVRGPDDVPAENGSLMTSGEISSAVEQGTAPSDIQQTLNPTLSGISSLDFNDPDAMIKAATDMYSKYPDISNILLNYGLSEKSNLSSYNRSLEASNTQYQRMVEDLRKAGLNPWVALSGLSSSGVSSGSTSYGTSSISSMAENRSTNRRGGSTAMIAALAMILVGLFRAIL